MSDPSDEHPDFRAALEVFSRDLRLAEITHALGREPDRERSRDVGDPLLQPGAPPRSSAAWRLELEFDRVVHRGCHGLSMALRDLGYDLADRAHELSERGCHVSVSVEQHLDAEDPATDGIHIDEFAIAWLARAGASLDIDQYPKDATLTAAVRGWAGARMWDLRELKWGARKLSRAIPALRHLLPLGPEEARPVARVRLINERLRHRALALLEEISATRQLPDDTSEADREDWLALTEATHQYADMLSVVAARGVVDSTDLHRAREFRMGALTSVRRWPAQWSLLTEADDLLDCAT
ncbi:hypothetical protein [Nocardioides sp. Root190]|uniref:hypothetical protein n=1 Tax=Nocardioides sp. Root190 TaxID=1736488 RepID=UPI0012F9FE41|nr:hypothetical protein [Nocardioides sp. Root190]